MENLTKAWIGSEIRESEKQCLILLSWSTKTFSIKRSWWFSSQLKKRIFWKYSEHSHLNIYSNWVHPRFLRGSRCLILSFLCFVYPFSFGQSNFDLRLLITSTPLVSSNFSFQMVNFVQNGSPVVAHHDIISVKHMMDLLRFVENPGLESSLNGFNLHSA